MRRLLQDSVASHLESEVPLGAFLSGGLDSSTVVALMARTMARRVQTFSIGFDEPEYNEAPHAALVASALGTDHTELVVRPNADALVHDMILGFDEPFADSSALPTLLVSHLARGRVTVALSGDGGDELFGGYRRYLEVATMGTPAPRVVRRLLRGLALMRPAGARGRAWLLNRSRGWRGRYTNTVAEPLRGVDAGIARADIAELVAPFEHLLDPWFDRFASRDFATQMMMVDFQTYLPGDILTKVDRMSMAVSLEARVPLLDHPLVEFANGLPSDLKLHQGQGKRLFRQAVSGLVPDSVLDKPKQGFALPLDHWFRGPLRYRIEALRRGDSAVHAWADADAIRRITTEHQDRRRDHQGSIWRLIVLDGWLEALARGDLSRSTPLRDTLSTAVTAPRTS